jgi:hypothetical protein
MEKPGIEPEKISAYLRGYEHALEDVGCVINGE